MAQSVILAFKKKVTAQEMASAYHNKGYKVLIVGPTDQALLAREDEDGQVWRSGPTEDLHLMIATKDQIIGPEANN